jgi:ribosomal protein L11 methyltransferase
VAPDPDAINAILVWPASPDLPLRAGAALAGPVRGGEAVIDYGCGSGILAIAALKFGASIAYGVDVDQQALLAARYNAMQNQVRLQLSAAADASMVSAQIVVANILAHPLIVLAPLLAGRSRTGGSLALSGILAEQAPEVLAAYHAWFDIAVDDRQEEWVLLSGRRR